MRNWLYPIVILTCLLMATNSVAAKKPTLRIVSPEIAGLSNANGTGTYWDIIRAALGDSYQLQLSTASKSQQLKLINESYIDAIITPENNQNFSKVTYSEQHIDTRYPIHILFDKDKHPSIDITAFQNSTLGLSNALSKLELLPNATQIYQVPSVENLARLVHNQRLSGILVYSYNIHFADPKKSLANIEWQPAKKMKLAFPNGPKGQRLAQEFDQAMSKLLSTGQLKTLFEKEADYLHANFEKSQPIKQFNWHLVPKKYSEDSKQLEPLAAEVVSSKYITNFITELDFNIQVNSSRVAIEGMAKSENHCILNLSKSPEREQLAVFSKPTYAFLPPKLMMLKGSKLNKQIQSLNLAEVSLPEIISLFGNRKIAIAKNNNTQNALIKAYGKDALKGLVQIDDPSLRNVLSLMLAKRVDGVIAWPIQIPSIIADEEIAGLITSQKLAAMADDIYFSYVACTNNDQGKRIIEQVNKLLSTTKHQQALFDNLLKMMDEGSANDFRQALKLN